jgi:hypothetical protein
MASRASTRSTSARARSRPPRRPGRKNIPTAIGRSTGRAGAVRVGVAPQQGERQLRQQPSAVAGLVGRRTATVRHARQRLEGERDDLVRGDAVAVRDEAGATGVALAIRVGGRGASAGPAMVHGAASVARVERHAQLPDRTAKGASDPGLGRARRIL